MAMEQAPKTSIKIPCRNVFIGGLLYFFGNPSSIPELIAG
jgi:hypothetical protein